jgi:hypothetical protein
MTSTNETSTGLGLFQNFFHAPNFTNFAATAQQPPEHLMRGFARWQLEVQGLMFRRAQSYLELPGRLSQCRSPQELMSEQQRFFQTMMSQYSESSRQIMGAWAQMFQMPPAPSSSSRQSGERDYLAFPEQRPLNGTGGDSEHYPSRKVA